ncbi:MAG: helix-turn-helix transcriptional regulator [Saprospiraceae bacterium]|nr:helix-turn-helix transcriptional regulator [Saprospiraceae bacterium]
MSAALLQQVELLIGSIGVILGLFFSALIATNRQSQPRANIFLAIYLLAFSLRVGKSLFHNYFSIDPVLRTFFLTTLLGVGPSIWLYVTCSLSPTVKRNRVVLLHYVPFFLFASFSWLIPNNGSWVFGVFYNFLIAHMFAYTLFSLLRLNRSRDSKILQDNPALAPWLYHFLTVNLIFLLLYFLISEMVIPFYIGISFLFSSVIIYLSFLAFRKPALFKVVEEKYGQSSVSVAEATQLIQRLLHLMEVEKPYLDASLSLSKLSAQLDVSTKILSQVINQEEGLNYSQFVSKYRVEEVKRLMTLPAYSNMTIAAMAYDSGFSSISTFNAAFKRHAGQTAKAYRKELEQEKN